MKPVQVKSGEYKWKFRLSRLLTRLNWVGVFCLLFASGQSVHQAIAYETKTGNESEQETSPIPIQDSVDISHTSKTDPTQRSEGNPGGTSSTSSKDGEKFFSNALNTPKSGNSFVSKSNTESLFSLSQAIEEAIHHNPVLKASGFEVTSKEAQVGPRGSYEDPMVFFEAQNYPIDTFSPREFGMTGNQISLSQKIPFPGKLSKQRQVAQQEANAQKQVFLNKQLQLIKDVKIAYYHLFLVYKKQEILEEELRIIRQLIGVTRSQYTLGRKSQAEVLSFQVDEANLLDQELIIEKERNSVVGELNHLLGRADHSVYMHGRPEEIRKTPLDFTQYTEEFVVRKALKKNPGVSAMRSLEEASASKVSWAKRNYLPDFECKLGYTLRQASPGDRGVDFASAGVGLTLPLWALSKQSEEVRGALAERSKANALLEEERVNLSHMIHVNYAELVEADRRLKLIERGILPLAKQAVVAGRSAFAAGKLDYASLLASLGKRFQTERSYYEALTNYESKIAEFEALTNETSGAGGL